MRYLLLIAGETASAPPTDDQIQAEITAYNAYGAWLTEQGWLRSGEALQPAFTAKCVSVRNGERIVTDGPYAETKEQLGGYYEVDVPSLDDAIEAAARIPGAATGAIEIRPIVEFG
jgi:hypothetical protein